jgi:hypothetical protein
MKDPKGPVKAYKSPEELAKKHNLPLETIMKQVEIGTKVEGEHTTSKSGARITALQHIDEFPDYYTRLKKVEKIKEGNLHKWFKSKSKDGKPGWVNVVTGGTCASDEPGEGVPKCVSSEKRASMTKAERLSAARRKKAADPGQQEKSGAAKPTYVSTDKPKKKMNEESDVKGKGSGKKDACYRKVKARYDVWPSAYASGALVKCRQKGAANWGTKSEEANMTRYCPKCQKDETREECQYGPQFWDTFSLPSKPKLTFNQMKYNIATVHPANEQVIPENHIAIAMGKEMDDEGNMIMSQIDQLEMHCKRLREVVKSPTMQVPAWVQSKVTLATDYMDAAANYMSSKNEKIKENISIEDSDGNTFAEIVNIIGPNDIEPVVDEECWKGYTQKGMKKKGDRVVPNCVKEGYSNWREELQEDWQKVNRKDKTDGLSQKAVNAYRRENPGSKLQTAVTEKKPTGKRAQRRKNFCSRMGGMKKRLTSAETARDPDSKINKALRRWNCN